MKYIVLFIFAFAIAATPAAAQYGQKQQYSQVLPVIPLMQGMTEASPEKDPKDQTKLKNPDQTTAVVGGNDKQVTTYYQQEFWKQGWKNATPGTPNVFVKDGETITMTVEEKGGQTAVTFTRIPAGAKPQQGKGTQDDADSSKGN